MSKQFLRWPGFVENQIPILDPYSVKILAYVYSKSFFQNGRYTPIEYGSTEFSRILGMSRTIITDRVAQLQSIGYIMVKDKSLYPLENQGDAICPTVKKTVHTVDAPSYERPPREQGVPSDGQVLSPDGQSTEKTSTRWTGTPLYDSLTQGFETLLVFKQYLYSINIVVGADDLIKILGNIQNVEILKIMRKKSIDKELQGFEKNAAFQQCVEWIREIYKEEEKPGEELPVDRYLLYLLIQSIENDRNPAGKFITAVKKLKTDGTRFDLDMSEYKKVQQTQNDNEIMERRISSTQTMLRHQDRDRAKALADEARKLELFESRPDLVEALMPAARERAEKELEPLFGTRMDKKTGEDLSPQRERTRQLLTAVKLRALIEEQLEIEKKGKTG